jgi:hypothetical protein
MTTAGHSYAEQLARLRAALDTGRLPADLGRWLLDQLVDRAAADERIELRNALIRRAAALLPGSTWSRAVQLRDELARLTRSHGELDPVRALLAEAVALHPCPASVRQIFTILKSDPVVISEGMASR